MTVDPNFNARERLAVLYRHRRLVLLFIASAMISSLAMTYFVSERYAATTIIIYRPNPVTQFEGAYQQHKAMGFPVPAVYPFEALGLTVRQVCTSERILRPVVKNLRLDQPDTTERHGLEYLYHETKQGVRKFATRTWQVLKFGRIIEEDPTTSAILDLAESTKVDTRQKNYLAVLTVYDRDPARAARIADSIGSELINFLRESSVEMAREQGKDVDARLAEKRGDIEQLRAQIVKLKKANEFIDLQVETNLRLKTAEQVEEKRLAVDAELSAARAKLKSLREQLATLPALVKGSETVAEDPVFKYLREAEAAVKVELEGQIAKLPRDHPDIRSTRAKLESIKDQLAVAKATYLSQVGTELSKVHTVAHSEEVKVRAEIASLEAEQAAVRENLDKARGRVPSPHTELANNDLNLRLSVLEADFKKISTLREELLVSELTSMSEAQMLHPAAIPDVPSRPIKVYHVLLSGLLAVLLGVGMVYVADYGHSLFQEKKSG